MTSPDREQCRSEIVKKLVTDVREAIEALGGFSQARRESVQLYLDLLTEHSEFERGGDHV